LLATNGGEAERPRCFATKRRMWVCGTYRQGDKSEREVASGLTSKRLDKHINTFIPKLVSTSSEQIKRIVQIEIVMTIEMTSDEIVNLLLGLNVEVLEFVHSCELLDVKTVGEDTIW
jgi:hypothetical protein